MLRITENNIVPANSATASPLAGPLSMLSSDARPPVLIDRFDRRVSYLRMSVTDRCDFRCIYCMAEKMRFLPRQQLLSLEELVEVGRAFVDLGVRKIRLTGGEPLVRQNVLWLARELAGLPGLDELTMTSNGSRLERFAKPLREAGVRRLNISLDSLRPERFTQLTRVGRLEPVLRGIDAAIDAGFERIKLNSVVLKGHNDDEVLDLLEFAIARGLDISFIEEMPLGELGGRARAASYCSSDAVRAIVATRYALSRSDASTGGPSRYWHIGDSALRVGFISPHSDNFCAQCNRVRLTANGRLLLCLGNEHSVDLRAVLRGQPGDGAQLRGAIVAAMPLKPERHHFDLNEPVQILRFMNATGG